MKKSLIALAALATVATAAQAQSSVTVYGVMDAGIATLNNVNASTASWTGMANGGLSTSRFGFKGTEDLGGGLKANFVLESQLFPTTGIAGGHDAKNGDNGYTSTVGTTNTLFSRQATVGFENSFGRVDFGHANTIGYDKAVSFDPMNYGNFGAMGTYDPSLMGRANSQVKFYSAPYANTQLGLAYSTAGVAGESGDYTTREASLEYSANGLRLLAAYAAGTVGSTCADAANYCARYGTTGAGNNGKTGNTVYQFAVEYTIDAFKLNAGYDTKANKSAATAAAQKDKRVTYAGVTYSVNPVNKVTVAYYSFNDQTGANLSSNMTSARYIYSLSKRTDLYGIASYLTNGSAATKNIGDNANILVGGNSANAGATPSAGKEMTGFMVGVRHTF